MLLRRLVTAPDEAVLTLAGTIVFVDISGFTKLSERLARAGREGAEHLVDTISACFSTLLAEAYANGGSLLKFGGDALLLWFAGDEHVHARLRVGGRDAAARCGGSAASAPAPATSCCACRSACTAARYELFLVGGSHREYLSRGPAVGALSALGVGGAGGPDPRQRPDRGAAPRALPGRAFGAGRAARARARDAALAAQGRRRRAARRAGRPLPLDGAARAPARGAGASRAPHRDRLVPAVRRARRADRRGGRRRPPRSAVEEVVRAAQEAADRYEICILGSDIAADGGKLLFSAGAPRAIGDDEERMLLAMRHIIDAGTRLPVRVGVTRGHVFTGEVGPPYRRTYAVMGDVVNLAARLCAKAPWGEVYTIEPVLDRARRPLRARPRCRRSWSRARAGRSRRSRSERRAAGGARAGAAVRLPLVRPRRGARAIVGRRSTAPGQGSRLADRAQPARTAAASRGCSRRSASARAGCAAIRTICESYTPVGPLHPLARHAAPAARAALGRPRRRRARLAARGDRRHSGARALAAAARDRDSASRRRATRDVDELAADAALGEAARGRRCASSRRRWRCRRSCRSSTST